MNSKFNELKVSNDKYDVYITQKVFFGYTLKKFLKGTFYDIVQKIDINENLSSEELEKLAYGMLD